MKELFYWYKDAIFAILRSLTIITQLLCYNNNKINKVSKMKKTLILFLLMISFLFAKEDYSEMSTQELIAIMGYVKAENKNKFVQELKSRVSTMSENEKKSYENNLPKLNK